MLYRVVFILVVMLKIVSSFKTSALARSFHASSVLNMGLHDYSLDSLAGSSVKLDTYKGKVVLLENVATL
jgi:hypothetical protein